MNGFRQLKKNMIIMIAFVTPTIAHAQFADVGDYGDAPDDQPAGYAAPFKGVSGKFPTLFGTTNSRFGLPGGHTLNASEEFLGNELSIEEDARDPLDPDTVENLIDDDFDDGLIEFPCTGEPLPFPPEPLGVTLKFRVTLAPSAPPGIRYVNVLMDLNNDGEWRATSVTPFPAEWVVVDFPVNIAPGSSEIITVPAFLYPLSPVGKWARVAFTRTPISGSFLDDGTGWDGSGTFGHGEIEDFLLTSDLAFAGASADDLAFQFSSQAAVSVSTANAAVTSINSVLVNVNAVVVDAEAAVADASADATAVASSAAAAAASADAVAQACAEAQASAAAIASSCANCLCATACADAQAAASAAVQACAAAEAAVVAVATAAAEAKTEANASAAAAAQGLAVAQARATAIAASFATAQANAGAVGIAAANAVAAAQAAADARADAIAGACGGNAQAVADAVADAQANAFSSANAFAVAATNANAVASTLTVVLADAQVAAIAGANADAAAAANAFAVAQAASQASTAASTAQSAVAIAQALASASAQTSASCTGDCCPNTEFCVVDQLHITGPIPNTVPIGAQGSITASVQSDFTGVFGQNVVFTKLFGDFEFRSGTISPQGDTASLVTPPSGVVEMNFNAQEAGFGLVQVSLPESPVGTSFSFFRIVE